MTRRILLGIACVLGLATTASAQQINTYTETQTGPNLLPYGLPVPLPIESLTPVDGFRSYASLDARLQGLALGSTDLAAHDVGRTFNNRTIWAYVASDEDGVDLEGRPEAAFFINATTHAREWAAPEVSTATIERLVAGAGDGGLVRYLLDNTRLVIIPVHNIDGLLQTQRFPTTAIIGQDPDVSGWPRDGRMRRKNMRGVDEVLTTFGDHLGGIDLNRNHPPFWATSVGQGGSSANPNSLTFHGNAPHGEPENLAIGRAALLGPASRLRLGIDVHSFSRVFFSSNTARVRLNSIQANLISRMRGHHLQLSGRSYTDVPDPANRGIGAAAEYFAYEWLVPAWTLELEPQSSPVEYGGLNVNHGGFILPASQARRVRESWAETHAVAFYMMSGPPHLARVRVYDVASNALVLETRWQFDPASARRGRVTPLAGSLLPGRRYRVELGFSKPMRYRDAAGALAPLPGVTGVPTNPTAALVRDATSLPLDAATGIWLNDPARVLRYRDDTFAFEFNAPADAADYALEVGVRDMTGAQLDADPSTPVDWSAGAWSEWENAAGLDGDIGGADRSATLRVDATPVSLIEIVPDSLVVGEGDTVQIRLRRRQAGPERVEILRLDPFGDLSPPPLVVATWLPGESGERSVAVSPGENRVAEGERVLDVVLRETVDGSARPSTTLNLRVLDNDEAGVAVVRLRDPALLRSSWEQVRLASGSNHLVLDGGQVYVLPLEDGGSPPSGLPQVSSRLGVSGNGATWRVPAGESAEALLTIAADGDLSLDSIAFLAASSGALANQPLLLNAGELQITRARFSGRFNEREPLVRNTGVLHVQRSVFDVETDQFAPLLANSGGEISVDGSSIIDGASSPALLLQAGTVRVSGSTLARNTSAITLIAREADIAGPVFGHALLQDNVLSAQISPPIIENCDRPAQSLGYNIEDHELCGFDQPGDVSGLLLEGFAFDEALSGYAPTGEAIDGGAVAERSLAAGCGLVDQRGAPRPQTLTPGATPRCDIGAIELGVNPYRGIWQPDRDGHGVEIHTSGNNLLLVWYTYADDGQPTSYQAIAPLTGPHWEADLLQPRRDPQSGAVTTPRVGRVTLDFTSDIDARVGWRFDARATTGSERIRPAAFATGEPRFEVTGVWYPSAEPGYGATITRRGETTAVVLYYYDAQGNIRWVLGAGNAADALDLEMASFTGFCPDCSATTMPVTSRPAGRLLAHFHTPSRARLDTQIVYPGAAGGSWNREGAMLAPLNDPVDNRLTVPAAKR